MFQEKCVFVLLLVVACGASAFAAAPLDFGAVEAEAGVSRLLLSRPGRQATIIESREIEDMPAGNIAELLEHAAGVDIRQRGPGGVQQDIHLRGAGFEQTLILLDGVRMNDPQTGHHNLDLPIGIQDIERVEILSGDGSAFYGPSAAGGAINIVTKRPRETKAAIAIKGGKYGFTERALRLGSRRGSLSMSRSASDGHRDGTDFAISSMFADARFKIGGENVRVSGGSLDNRFGANGFYASWPSREKTATDFVNAALADDNGFSASLYSRVHSDVFLCSTANPALCLNRHRTRRNGAEVKQSIKLSGDDRLEIGVAKERDSIRSSNIGIHDMDHSSLFALLDRQVSKRIRASIAGRGDFYTAYGSMTGITAGADIAAGKNVMLRASAGSAHRIPSFTELYYKDPLHTALAILSPEKFISYEAGADYTIGVLEISATAYRRNAKRLIDWNGPTAAGPWKIANQGPARFQGLSLTLNAPLNDSCAADFSYDYLSIHHDGGGFLKYSTSRPKHSADAGLRWRGRAGSALEVRTTVEKMVSRKRIALVDIAYSKKRDGAKYTVEARNVLDRTYEDVAGARMPGISLVAGVEIEIAE